VLGFKCFHASCGEKHWKEFRTASEDEKGEKYQFAAGNPRAIYELTPEGIVHHVFTQSGEKTPVLLTNFSARIVMNVIEDDGVEKKNILEIEARCRNRKRRFAVAASDFSVPLYFITEVREMTRSCPILPKSVMSASVIPSAK
jgi:hypothetical protein